METLIEKDNKKINKVEKFTKEEFEKQNKNLLENLQYLTEYRYITISDNVKTKNGYIRVKRKRGCSCAVIIGNKICIGISKTSKHEKQFNKKIARAIAYGRAMKRPSKIIKIEDPKIITSNYVNKLLKKHFSDLYDLNKSFDAFKTINRQKKKELFIEKFKIQTLKKIKKYMKIENQNNIETFLNDV